MEKDKPSGVERLKQGLQSIQQRFSRKETPNPSPDKMPSVKDPEKSATPKPAFHVPKTERGSVDVNSVKHPRQNNVPFRGEITENVQARMQRGSGVELKADKVDNLTKVVAAMEKGNMPKSPESSAPNPSPANGKPAVQKSNDGGLARGLEQKSQAITNNQTKQTSKATSPDKSQSQKQERNINMQEHQKQHMQPAQNPTRDTGRDR